MGFLSAEQLLLDEAQGVTTNMIVECIERKGWRLTANRMEWQTLDKRTSYIRSISAWYNGILAIIATHEEMTLQALLREINPRMRKGCPSEAARRKHDGFWLMRLPYSPPTVVKWNESQAGWQAQQVNCNDVVSFDDAAHCFFWPCDAEANKIRWPTDDNGNML